MFWKNSLFPSLPKIKVQRTDDGTEPVRTRFEPNHFEVGKAGSRRVRTLFKMIKCWPPDGQKQCCRLGEESSCE